MSGQAVLGQTVPRKFRTKCKQENVLTTKMSDQDYQNQFYNPQGQEAGYDMSSMPMDQQFGQFDYSQAASYEAPFVPEPAVQPQQSNPYAGSILTPATDTFNTFTPAPTGDSFEDEPPLMEELGINFDHIMQKVL
ncbi:Protein YIPF5 [Lamellibrachia satsuma]|nr:Protein YIPF5 [Lamellibrachia satsuma]